MVGEGPRREASSPRRPAERPFATLTHDWLGQHLLEASPTRCCRGRVPGSDTGSAVDDVEAALHEVRDRLEREQRLHVSAGDLTPKALAAAIAVEVAPDSEEDRILVREMVLEMAAKQNKRIVRGFATMLDRIFNTMFAGLDLRQEELEALRETARSGPLIFCPSHRSHVDYLVLSYVLVSAGMIPPLVAAGENLNIFPLGRMFRGGGAFYIRRSFRDDPLYRATFAAYLRHLLLAGVSIEFSRGHAAEPVNASPRFGMVAVIDAYQAAPMRWRQPLYPRRHHVREGPEIGAHSPTRWSKESSLDLLKLRACSPTSLGR